MCDSMKADLAICRARQTNRDLETTFMEVQWEVTIELGKTLAETTDLVFVGTKRVNIEEEDGGVCGICLEDMEKGKKVK
ncbi:hypothetical protein V6N13_095614 [Hibiscus sabdariffa]